MISKKDLLKNLRGYTPEEIAEAVKAGTVTLYELAKESEGAFTPLLKKKVKEILDRPVSIEVTSPPVEAVQIPQPPIAGAGELPVTNMIQMEPAVVLPVEQELPIESSTSFVYEGVVDNKGMFKRPFNFMTGRIRRMEFWLSIIIFNFYTSAISMFVWMINCPIEAIPFLLVPGYVFVLAQGSKRCHDRGNSGWYQLIPFYGFWMVFADSEPGVNKFGNNPKI